MFEVNVTFRVSGKTREQVHRFIKDMAHESLETTNEVAIVGAAIDLPRDVDSLPIKIDVFGELWESEEVHAATYTAKDIKFTQESIEEWLRKEVSDFQRIHSFNAYRGAFDRMSVQYDKEKCSKSKRKRQ